MKAIKDKEKYFSYIFAVAFFGVWEWASRAGVISHFIFPQPTHIVLFLINAMTTGELWESLMATLSRLFIGFLAGGFPGLLIGLLMGWRPRIRAALEPMISALHPIPKISLFPLLLVIFGIGETSKIVLIALAVFFPTLVNALEGVSQISPVYFEVAQNMRASRWLIFKRIILPASLPFVLAGTRIALNIGLIVTLSIELLNGASGLGVMMWFGWQMMRLEQVYGIVFLVGIIGTFLNVFLRRLMVWLTPWYDLRAKSEY
jgi:NitT/TauT family transport system permease protein